MVLDQNLDVMKTYQFLWFGEHLAIVLTPDLIVFMLSFFYCQYTAW